MSNYKYTDVEKKWIVDNNDNYSGVKNMHKDFCMKFKEIKYKTFCSLRKRLVETKSRLYTEEEKNFITECIVDREIGYAQLEPLFNKKFNKHRTAKQLCMAGNKWGLKVIHYNYKWREGFTPNIPDEYHFKNQAPVGTIRKVKRGGKYKLIIKIKEIPLELICSKRDFRDDREYWYPYARYIYEKHYNCKLKENEYVYHLDGNIENNNIENLICGTYGVLGYVVGKGFNESNSKIREIGFKLGKLNSLIKGKENQEEVLK